MEILCKNNIGICFIFVISRMHSADGLERGVSYAVVGVDFYRD